MTAETLSTPTPEVVSEYSSTIFEIQKLTNAATEVLKVARGRWLELRDARYDELIKTLRAENLGYCALSYGWQAHISEVDPIRQAGIFPVSDMAHFWIQQSAESHDHGGVEMKSWDSRRERVCPDHLEEYLKHHNFHPGIRPSEVFPGEFDIQSRVIAREGKLVMEEDLGRIVDPEEFMPVHIPDEIFDAFGLPGLPPYPKIAD